MKFSLRPLAIAFLCSVLLLGATSCRTVYYGAMEKIGFEKRDLLVRAVKAAKAKQKEAGGEYRDALTQLQAVYGRSGSNLEKAYDKLNAEYLSCETATGIVKHRIDEMDRVASDLFKEWQKEVGTMSDASLAGASQTKLIETKASFATLSSALHTSYDAMPPVLAKLRDHTLYLKHNLNAESLGALRGKAAAIQGDIQVLLDRMNRSISEADAFVKTMN
jgi:hypothetical protein